MKMITIFIFIVAAFLATVPKAEAAISYYSSYIPYPNYRYQPGVYYGNIGTTLSYTSSYASFTTSRVAGYMPRYYYAYSY